MLSHSLDTLLLSFSGQQRDALLPALWKIQTAFGFINPDSVAFLSHLLRIPEAEIYGVIEFYSLFQTEDVGRTVFRICTDPICALAGADQLMEAVRERVKDQADDYTVLHSTCLGLCDHAPAALVSARGSDETTRTDLRQVDQLLAEDLPDRVDITGGQQRILLPTGDGVESLTAYGDYLALRRALAELTPEQVVAEVDQSGLIGRGGAAFPTGQKWKLPPQTAGQIHYVVCNADESEPGTFKDRLLLERRPHLMLEGMALCAYAIGAHDGFLFIRGEYPQATQILQNALNEAEQAGILGDNGLLPFRIQIRRGAGAYICGEETALFEAIEGKRGFPRIKPPFPTVQGLFGKPTVINNVETFCNIPGIIQHGASWFRQWGTPKSTGTKLVSVSGHVERPGVYEIVPGLTLRALLDDYCGGVTGRLKAVLMGGASGTFLTPDEIDVPLTFEALRGIGSAFGSGAVMVFNDGADLRGVLRRLGRFFQHESCGKCFPCQLGTQRQMEILERLNSPLPGDARRLADVGLTMTEASLCGLGQTAASAVLSALKKWPELFVGGS